MSPQRPPLAPPGASLAAARWMGGVLVPAVWTLVAAGFMLSAEGGRLRLASMGWVAGGTIFLGVALFTHAHYFLRSYPRLRAIAHWLEMLGSAAPVAAVVFLLALAVKRLFS